MDPERKSVSPPRHGYNKKLIGYSDGKSPDAIAQQILAITPILKGQRPTQQTNMLQQHQHQQPSQSYVQPPANVTPGNTDLIDFGNGSAGPTASHSQPMQSQVTESQHVPYGLQEPLQPQIGEPIRRQDTTSSDIDEFVDADDGR